MPYKLHRWDWDEETASDPGWPRHYLTYDHHTACEACHESNGLLRVLQHLFGGPIARCRHPRRRGDQRRRSSRRRPFSNSGWGGDVGGYARRKGCKAPAHYAVAFRPGVDASSFPDKVGLLWRYRTRLPGVCHDRTPSGHKPMYTVPNYGAADLYAEGYDMPAPQPPFEEGQAYYAPFGDHGYQYQNYWSPYRRWVADGWGGNGVYDPWVRGPENNGT
ncbi:hypothetical protein GGR58DRAFT_522285 [Xylaria digitata]|nr:hypothetical protein GGR58DRAFT_522285 [Xylaria digitata]